MGQGHAGPLALSPVGHLPCTAAGPEREHLRGASSPAEKRGSKSDGEADPLTSANSFRRAPACSCSLCHQDPAPGTEVSAGDGDP